MATTATSAPSSTVTNTANKIHPARLSQGVHLPYSGREVQIFSKYGYFTPEGYESNTQVCRRNFISHIRVGANGGKPMHFVRFGMGAAKFFGAFLLFYGPLDNLYCSLRRRQRMRRDKNRA